MRMKILERMLGGALAFVMGVSSPISAYAQSDYEEIVVEDVEQTEETFDSDEEITGDVEVEMQETTEQDDNVGYDVEDVYIGVDTGEETISDEHQEDEPIQKEENEKAFKFVFHYSLDSKSEIKEEVYKLEDENTTFNKRCFEKTGYSIKTWYCKETRDYYYSDDSISGLLDFADRHNLNTINLYAEWEPITYVIRLNDIDYAVPNPNNNKCDSYGRFEVKYDEEVDLSKYVFTRDGYTFKNWTDYEGDKEKTYSAKSKLKNLAEKENSIVDLYAQWSPNTQKIVYKLNGGKQDKAPTSFVTGTDIQLMIPTKKGYVFDGWTIKVAGRVLYDYELEAVFDEENNILRGAENFSILCGDIELSANYKDMEYTIVFCDENGEAFETQPQGFGSECPIKYNDTVDFYNAAKELKIGSVMNLGEGDTIKGFSKKPGGKVDFVAGKYYSKLSAVPTEIKLYPVVNKKANLIDYKLNGGKLASPVCTYVSGKRTTLPKATKDGCKFLGWEAGEYEGEDPFVYKTVKKYDSYYEEYYEETYVTAIKAGAKGTVEVSAKFAPIDYYIYVAPNASGVKETRYNDDGDEKRVTVTKKAYIGYYNVEDGVDINGGVIWDKAGYDLIGYSADPKAKTYEDCIDLDEYFAERMKKGIYGPATVYCVWQPIDYYVYFVQDASACYTVDGEEYGYDLDISSYVPEKAIYHYGKGYTLPKPQIPGFTFDCWKTFNMYEPDLRAAKFTKKNGKIVQIKADNTVETIVLIAKFKANTCTLKFDPNGGVYADKYEDHTQVFDLFEIPARPIRDDNKLNDTLKDISLNTTREGYVLKGLYLDKNGKKPLPADCRELFKKVKDTVTIYAVWDKR